MYSCLSLAMKIPLTHLCTQFSHGIVIQNKHKMAFHKKSQLSLQCTISLKAHILVLLIILCIKYKSCVLCVHTYNQCSCKALLTWSINQTLFVEIDN